jgi:hypothetical protein
MLPTSVRESLMNLFEAVNAIRQNHALEHATIHVLSQRFPYRRLVGRSNMLSGFVIYAALDSQTVEEAAREALARLQQGEAYLAVHPRCGTNLAVTSVMAGVAAFGATLGPSRSRWERLPLALMAATLASIAAQPLAHKVQERVTTSPEVDGLSIRGIRRAKRGSVVSHTVLVGRE